MDEGGGGAEEAENACLDALHALTSVRALLVGGLHSGAFQSTIMNSANSKQQPFACIPVTSRCCDDLDMPTYLLAGRYTPVTAGSHHACSTIMGLQRAFKTK